MDKDLRLVQWNARALSFFQIDAEAMGRQTAHSLLRSLMARAKNPNPIIEALRTCQTDPEAVIEGPLEIVRPEPRVFWRMTAPVYNLEDVRIGRMWTFRDVTENQRVERAARENEERYRVIAEAASDAILTIDEGGEILFASKAAERIFGYRLDELVGRPLSMLLPEHLRPPHLAHLPRRPEAGDGSSSWESVPLVGLRKDGAEIAVELSLGEFVKDGKRLFTGLLRDVTERKKSEEALRRRDAILEAVSFAAEQFLTSSSWVEKIQPILQRLGEAAGVSRSLIYEVHSSKDGSVVESLRHEWTADGVRPLMEDPRSHGLSIIDAGFGRWIDALKQGDVVHGTVDSFPSAEKEFLESMDIRSCINVPVFVEGCLWGYISFDDCLTDRLWSLPEREALKTAAGTLGAALQRQRAEEAVRRSERKFRELFEAAADAIALVDGRGNILDINPAGEAIMGMRRADLIGRNLSEILPEEDEPRWKKHIGDIIRSRGPDEPFEVTLRGADGRRTTLEVRSRRVVHEEEAEPRVEIVARDVTERLELQRRLLESERLASMGRLSAYVAHEINTPLTNISLLTAAIVRRAKDREILGKLEKISAQRRIASAIINDLLRFSQHREVNAVDVDVKAIIRAALEQVEPYRKKGVSLRRDIEGPPVIARVDAMQIQEVLMNLLKNALEATSRGSVSVDLEDRPEAVLISVVDTGTGMAQDVQARLFEPFFTTKKVGEGTGLGLSMCKSIVNAHGGTIQVSSDVGKGSTFTVMLPRSAQP